MDMDEILLKMKLITLLMFAAFLSASASSYSQSVKFNLNMKEVSIRDVFQKIEEQSKFIILFNEKSLNVDRKVTVTVKDETVDKILDQIFNGEKEAYQIFDRQILISKLNEIPKIPLSDIKNSDVQQPQKKELSGTVKDDKGLPLPGVSVIVKGKIIGTVTDHDGKFELSIPSDTKIIVFSFVGMKMQEIAIGGKTTFNIEMMEETIGLDEVVAVGYGKYKRVDLSSSSSTVSLKVFEETPALSIDAAMQGRAAGVQVTSSSGEPGAGVSILVRGNNSVNASNQPLYVIDGAPLFPGSEATGNSSNGLGQQGAPSNPNSFLNPNDVESIEILKDAAATAIYGSRGANGVILITTKKGKAGKARIDVSYDMGIKRLTNFPEMMSGPEFAELYNELNPLTPFRGYIRPIPANTKDRNYANEVIQDGITKNLLLSISGGNEKNTFYLTSGYYNELGNIRTSKYERGTLRFSLTNQISSRLSITTLINASRTGNRRTSNGSGAIIGGDAILDVLRAKPVADEFTDFNFINDDLVGNAYNPVLSLKRKDVTINNDFLFNGQIKYNIIKGLIMNINPGVSFRDSRRDIFFPSTEGLGARTKGYASLATLSNQNYIVESFLSYNVAIKSKHNLSLVGGFSAQKIISMSLNSTAQNFLIDNLGSDNIALATIQNPPIETKWQTFLQSFFFRSNFSFFKSKYLLSYTLRRDGYSAFAANNKYAIFQAGSLGWNIFKEDFLRNSKIISNLKLRASYGTSGTTSIAPYGSLYLQSPQNAVVNGVIIGGVGPQSLGNPDLKWETTKQTDIGIDLGILKDRLSLTVDIYRKNTVNLLQSFTLPPSSGYGSYLANVGNIRNQGLEIDFSGTPVYTKDFRWNSSLNLTFPKSLVMDLGGNSVNGIRVGGNFFGPLNRIVAGSPYAVFYGFRVLGLQQYSDYNPATGLWKYAGEKAQPVGSLVFEDVNQDGKLDDLDYVQIGNPNPKYTFGFNNDFKYKNWNLSVFFQGSVGNDIFNATSLLTSCGSTAYGNQRQDWWINRWTPENQHNDIRYPSFTVASQMFNNSKGVEDGSYVRLKNIRIGYNFPAKILSVVKLKSVTAYITLNNIITWTKYSGFDPEVNSGTAAGITNNNIGSDIGSYPRANTLLFGLKVGF
jgi:TonB-linked SusC/RagA family outer membrane protein